MQPEGVLTADQAEAICRATALALAAPDGVRTKSPEIGKLAHHAGGLELAAMVLKKLDKPGSAQSCEKAAAYFRSMIEAIYAAIPAGYRLIPAEMPPTVIERMASNLSDEFGPDFVAANKAFALAVYAEAFASGIRPVAPEAQGAPIVCDVLTMRLSDGRADYFTRIRCGDRDMTIFKFGERYKAQYSADEFAWLLGLRPDKPNLMAYDEESHPDEPASTSSVQEA